MSQKFLIFMNTDRDYSIHLGMVDFHREIKVPKDATARCGGGKWEVSEDGTLRLYDKSEDFGPYDKEQAKEAFEDKAVFYFGEECFDEFNFKSLKTE